jgi:hypothetical protein
MQFKSFMIVEDDIRAALDEMCRFLQGHRVIEEQPELR